LSPDLPHGASRRASSSRRPCHASSLVFYSSLVFCRASVPLSLAVSRLRASVLPCFPRLAAPCLRLSLTALPLHPLRLVSLPRAYSRGFHFRQSPGLVVSKGITTTSYNEPGGCWGYNWFHYISYVTRLQDLLEVPEDLECKK
ncbi:hypothetical protein HN51_059651, partial [Arachis hypogaea]